MSINGRGVRIWFVSRVQQALLALQRHAALVPSPARRMARILVTRVRIGAEGFPEGWDRPLVAGTSGSGLPASDPAPLPTPERPQRDLGALACLVVTDSLDVGGMDAFVDFLVRGLRSRGAAVGVLIAADRPDDVDGRIAAGLRADGFEVSRADRTSIAEQMRRVKADCVSAHGTPDWALDAAVGCGLPVVETLHGMHTFDDRARLGARSQNLAAVVAVSEHVRTEYLTWVQPDVGDRVVVIPNGVASRRQSMAVRQEARAALGLVDEFVFVSLGRYCLQKNTFGLVTCFDAVAAAVPDARLVIAGRVDDASYYAQVAARRDRSRFRARIHLRDHVAAPSALLAASDAFVLDSFFEGWSLASTEALTAGLPVVLAEVGGAVEQVSWPDPPGIVVPSPLGARSAVRWEEMAAARFRPQLNAADLTEAMIDLAGHRRYWAGRREEIAHEAEGRFAPQVCLDRHADVLTGVSRTDRRADVL